RPDAPGCTTARILALYELPLLDLLMQAQDVHRQHHQANAVQLSSLLSVKTGACPEDCSYCPQSSRYDTAVQEEAPMPLEEASQAATDAKENGAQRFWMGAARRSPTGRQVDSTVAMGAAVNATGLGACVTLGMLKDGQAERLRDAGLEYYNH